MRYMWKKSWGIYSQSKNLIYAFINVDYPTHLSNVGIILFSANANSCMLEFLYDLCETRHISLQLLPKRISVKILWRLISQFILGRKKFVVCSESQNTKKSHIYSIKIFMNFWMAMNNFQALFVGPIANKNIVRLSFITSATYLNKICYSIEMKINWSIKMFYLVKT